MSYGGRIEAARFIEELPAFYPGGWYSAIRLHGGGSPIMVGLPATLAPPRCGLRCPGRRNAG